MIPGELVLRDEDVVCNRGKRTVTVEVSNTGDRPIQIGSHYHFFETNKDLQFDREKAFGMRLNIPGSTAVRFEPGEQKQVVLVEFGGDKNIFGFNNLTDGNSEDESVKASAMEKARQEGFKGAV